MNDTQRQNYRGNEAVFAWHDEARPPEVRERAAGFEAEKQEIAPWFSREAAAVWAACGAFEWIALGYLGLSSALIATFAENLAHPAKLIGVQALAALIILALCRIGASYVDEATRTGEIVSTKFWHFWRHWYPHLFFSFLLRRTSETGTPGESTMGGREAPRVRPMAHGCESFPVAGAVCASSAE